MANLGIISRLTPRPALAVVLRYGLAVSSVAAALGTTLILRHYNLVPRFISHCTLVAIAITFWYAGSGPGLLAFFLSRLGSNLLARNHFLAPDFPLKSVIILYAVFSVLLGWFSAVRRRVERLLTEARDNLEFRVAERTAELTKANEQLQNTQAQLWRREAYLAEAQSLSRTGSFGWSVLSGEIFWSDETFRIFEFDQTVKPTLELVLKRIHPDDRELVQQTIDRVTNERTDFDLEHRLMMPDGRVKHIHVLARALQTSSGNLEFVGAVTDVTVAKQSEEKLRRSEADLLEAQRLSHTGSWRHNLLSGEVTLSPEIFRIRGIQADDDPSRAEFFFDRIHPEDRTVVKQIYERARIQKTDYESNYRIVPRDGTIKHLHTIGHPILNESGDVVEFFGTATDVTEQCQAEEKIRQSEGQLRQLLDLTPMHITEFGPDGTPLYSNQASLDYHGVTLEEHLGPNNLSLQTIL